MVGEDASIPPNTRHNVVQDDTRLTNARLESVETSEIASGEGGVTGVDTE